MRTGKSMSERKFIVFKLANEFYGIPIEDVERILTDQSITKLPKTPEMFLGVFELRGETVPAIDLRKRFEFDPWDDVANYIVVLTKLGRCAFRVDGVDGLATIDETDIDETAEILKHEGDDFIAGIGKQEDRLIVILKPDNVLPAEVREHVAAAGSADSETVAA